MQTPLWVPILVATIGVIGTVTAGAFGVVVTQRHAEHRDNRSWERERQREHERWIREDADRTFEQRYRAYSTTYGSLRARHAVAHKHTAEGSNLPEDWDSWAFHQVEIAIFGSSEVVLAVSAAHEATLRLAKDGNEDRANLEQLRNELYAAEVNVLRKMRQDLSVPGANDVSYPIFTED
jgi:Ni/Co efflux regulator RcnB